MVSGTESERRLTAIAKFHSTHSLVLFTQSPGAGKDFGLPDFVGIIDTEAFEIDLVKLVVVEGFKRHHSIIEKVGNVYCGIDLSGVVACQQPEIGKVQPKRS